jgi:iron complex transport system substrate-binding protein
MKEKVNYTIAVVVWVLLLCSCSGGGKTSYHVGEGDTLSFRYARNLSVVNYRDYQVAEIRNPWDTTKVLHKYILVDKNQELPKPLPEGTVVRIPLTTTVVYTAVHCALMEDLGVLNSIVGVCDVDYIIRPNILERCEKGEIVNLGSAMSPNAEQIILLAPDAILLSPFENSGGNGTFEKYGIPIIECADYMETSALARAEWIRFYGLLYGVNEVADSMFYVIENRYQYLKDLVKSVGQRPKMMCDLKGGAAWYVPGGNSYLGQLFQDAGADYAFAYLKDSGSVPLSFETVYDKAKDADVWCIKYNGKKDKTYTDLLEEYAPYSGFKAFVSKNIYDCNTNKVPFYEEVPFHPDLLLSDIIKMLHPGVLEDDSLKYYHKLAE